MKRLPIALALGALLAPTLALADDDCDYEASRKAVVDADGADTVTLDVDAGSLTVRGVEGLTEVRIHGTACASKERLLEDIQLEARRSGSRVVVKSEIDRELFGWNSEARLDLTLEVPAGIALEIEDGSGSIEIADVGDVEIEDGSGSIEIENAGHVRIEDGSGEIDIRGSRGAWIKDGSGSIYVRRSQGDVEVREDGSGSITILGVVGNVWIREDGSGSIRVEEVSGDLTVDRDGSGGISWDDVNGRVRVP